MVTPPEQPGRDNTRPPLTPPERRLARRRRLAGIAMWICIATAAITATAWAVSTRWSVFAMAQFGDAVGINAGVFSRSWTSPELRQQLSSARGVPIELQWDWQVVRRQAAMTWWPLAAFTSSPTGGRHALAVTLWTIAAPATAGALACWWLRRRLAPPGLCAGCRYPLVGLKGNECPECGLAFPVRAH